MEDGLLQKLGTELGRANNPQVWINCVKEVVKALRTECDFFLVPDCRFPNELDWDDTPFFTYTIRINRKNEDGTNYVNHLTDEQKQHLSEISLDDYRFNYEVESKTLEDLALSAESILEDVLNIEEGE